MRLITCRKQKIAIIKNWLSRKALQVLETLMPVEKERCNTMEGLFNILINKFKQQYNETIKLLQIFKLVRQMNKMQRNGLKDIG